MKLHMSEREKKPYGNDTVVMSKQDDCTIYRITNETGEVVMTRYAVFDGIDLVYNDVHIEQCSAVQEKRCNIIEINHCREGRIECEFENAFFYLSRGDMAISHKEDATHDVYFPIHHYHGISIVIDVDKAPDCLSFLLDDVNVKPTAIVDKFCHINQCCVMRKNVALEHIFSELYSVPESIKKGYFKVKILELLLFLSGMECLPEETACFYSRQQVQLAKGVCRYLMKHMDNRVTLKQLTAVFHVSGTHLKNCFKGVYGTSIYAYIRTQKMQAAAILLQESNDTILSIAGRFGYDNGSKFAKAFQDVMAVTPNAYRTKMERAAGMENGRGF